MSRVDEIEARMSRATAGPWDSGSLLRDMDGDYCVWKRTEPGKQREFLGNVGGVVEPIMPKDADLIYFDAEKHDAEFIAHAPEDVRYLLARVRALEAGLTTYGEHRGYCSAHPITRTGKTVAVPVFGPCTCGLAALVGGE